MLRINEWCNKNDMVINSNKSKSMLVGSNQKIRTTDDVLNVICNDFQLENVDNEKLLGITIDSTLSWSQHICNLISKISSRIGLMCRLRSYLPKEGLIMYYNAYILPLFDYCCIIWGNTSDLNIEKVYKLQKRAARIILNAKRHASSLILFKELGWLTFMNRIKYHKGVLMFKCIKGNAPPYLSDLFNKPSHERSYSTRSSNNGNLFVPRPNSNYMKKTFHYSGTVLWNSLPTSLKNIQTIDAFKSQYSNFLFLKQPSE